MEKDKEIEKIIKENCKTSMSNKEKKIFSDCNFIFPQLNKIDYLPDNSKIVSIEIVKNKRKQFQKINLQANYFNIKIDYERCYYYDGKNIQKIKTFIKDSISTDIIMDYYSRINLD